MSQSCLLQRAMRHGFRHRLRPPRQVSVAYSLGLPSDVGSAASRSSSSSSVPPERPSKPSWQEQPQLWMRRAKARAELARDEWYDRADDWRYRSSTFLRQGRRRLEKVQRSWSSGNSASSRTRNGRSGLAVNDFIERAQARYTLANRQFDDWFNAQWPLLQDRLQAFFRRKQEEFRRKLKAPKQREAPRNPGHQTGPPLDVAAMVMLGAGAGGALQGWPGLGLMLAASGATRFTWRFVIAKIDAQDLEGLFRWAPAFLRARRFEIFQRLTREVGVGRAIRAGDPQFVDLSYDKRGHKAMDPLNDYTPEKLFDDVMTSVAVHPRMQEVLGGGIRAVQEPDKVVYRIVEGVAEVYLGWKVAGPVGGAEIQVKATASLVDYIYVFPDPTGRYGVAPAAFVIRPDRKSVV